MVFNRRVCRQNTDENTANFIKANVLLAIYIAVFTSPAVLSNILLPSIEQPADYVKTCAPILKCDANATFRTIDGSCNNMQIPWLGATKTPHIRLLNASYADGVYEIRKQTNGSPLPNARQVQIDLFLNRQSTTQIKQNIFFLEIGQFFAHDTTHLPPNFRNPTDCCDLQSTNPIPVQCQAVIPVPKDDPVYTKLGQKCISFSRAETSAEAVNCTLKPATFMVHSSHFIDGSLIYGTNDNEAKNLRDSEGGRLRSEIKNGNEFCPQTRPGDGTVCDQMFDSKVCYVTGDPRVNQNLGIALLQNLFLRLHNKVVNKLQCINKHWDDETLYQNGRNIVICVLQNMLYTHYVPTLLGQKYYDDYIKQAVYDDKVNPSTSLEFSTGALRVLHNEIPETLNLCGKMSVEITKTMNKPDLLPEEDNFDRFINGFLNQPARAEQPSYNPLISNFLFNQTRAMFRAQDLMAIDIQRGRDVGLRSYNDVRALCGLELLQSFDNLVGIIDKKDADILKTLYASINDVDFIVGALLEKKLQNEKIGPTTKCIMADSFYRYKVGDSHFYDRLGQPWSLTQEQLKAVKNISLSTVICATSGIKKLPENVFVTPDSSTVLYECDHFPLNLDAWLEPTTS